MKRSLKGIAGFWGGCRGISHSSRKKKTGQFFFVLPDSRVVQSTRP